MKPPPPPPEKEPQTTAVVIDVAALFGSRREVLLRHAGSLYRLRITQNNKLILTK